MKYLKKIENEDELYMLDSTQRAVYPSVILKQNDPEIIFRRELKRTIGVSPTTNPIVIGGGYDITIDEVPISFSEYGEVTIVNNMTESIDWWIPQHVSGPIIRNFGGRIVITINEPLLDTYYIGVLVRGGYGGFYFSPLEISSENRLSNNSIWLDTPFIDYDPYLVISRSDSAEDVIETTITLMCDYYDQTSEIILSKPLDPSQVGSEEFWFYTGIENAVEILPGLMQLNSVQNLVTDVSNVNATDYILFYGELIPFSEIAPLVSNNTINWEILGFSDVQYVWKLSNEDVTNNNISNAVPLITRGYSTPSFIAKEEKTFKVDLKFKTHEMMSSEDYSVWWHTPVEMLNDWLYENGWWFYLENLTKINVCEKADFNVYGDEWHDTHPKLDSIIYNGNNTDILLINNEVKLICNKEYINIPPGVSLGSSFACGCDKLKSITLPNTIGGISRHAFYGCTSLEQINLPSSLKSIAESAFQKCSSLTSVVIPEGVTSIGGEAFSLCAQLESIDLPSTITFIGGWAFYHLPKLKLIIWRSTSTIDPLKFRELPATGTLRILEGSYVSSWLKTYPNWTIEYI